MEAVRCTECGETRWSLFPGSLARASRRRASCAAARPWSSGAGPAPGPERLDGRAPASGDRRPDRRGAACATLHALAERGRGERAGATAARHDAARGADDGEAAPAAVHRRRRRGDPRRLRRPRGDALRRPRRAPDARRDRRPRCASTARCWRAAATRSWPSASARPARWSATAGCTRSAARGPDVELGYTLARTAWGRGYATELGRALVDHAFGMLRRAARRRAGRAGQPRLAPRAREARHDRARGCGRPTAARISSTRSTARLRRRAAPRALLAAAVKPASSASASPRSPLDLERAERAVGAERADPRLRASRSRPRRPRPRAAR